VTRRGLIVVAVVAITLAIGWWVARSDHALGTDWIRSAKEAPSAGENSSIRSRGNQADLAVRPNEPPLPGPNLPLGEIAPALRSAAAEGSPAAACRLAMEVLRCRQHRVDLRGIEELRKIKDQRGLDGETAARIEQGLREIDDRIARDRAVCQGAAELRDEPWQLLLNAAQGGHVPSMAKFALSSAVRDDKGRGEWNPDALAAYRTFAFPYLTRASESGDVAATEKLGFELMAQGSGTRAIPRDPVRGLAYLKALLAVASAAYRAELSPKIDTAVAYAGVQPPQLAAAEALAKSILPPAFAGNAEGRVDSPKDNPENNFGCVDGTIAISAPSTNRK
jgi:hypothetical protein